MAELKTKATKQKAKDFLKTIEPEEKRKDSLALLAMFEKITGQKPVMWGTAIVGFGRYHYESTRSSQKGDWPLAAFSPRKQNLTLYCMMGNEGSGDLLKKLGKHKISGGSCIYINKLSDIHAPTLIAIIKDSVKEMKRRYKA